MKDVSIILCSYNRAGHLEKTLQSLRQVEVPNGWTAELILVDNASTDATPNVMRAFTHPQMSVRVAREKSQGQCCARNRGIAEAEGNALLFTDDDVRFPRGWVRSMGSPILEGKADAVAGGVALAPQLQRSWMTPLHRSFLASTELISPENPCRLVGANMAVARAVFETIPQFDPELDPGAMGFGGDSLFSEQLRIANFSIAAALDIAVKHHPDPSRLSSTAWKQTAKTAGRSEAYISYHWAHRQWPVWKLFAGWTYYCLQLLGYRLYGPSEMPADEGMPLREFELRRKAARVRQHLRERGIPPKYACRGMVKRTMEHKGDRRGRKDI